MANKEYRNITIIFKNGKTTTVKKVRNSDWGIIDGFFYVQFSPIVKHDAPDYYEEMRESHHYPLADIERIDSEAFTRVEGRREIFEHKRDAKHL